MWHRTIFPPITLKVNVVEFLFAALKKSLVSERRKQMNSERHSNTGNASKTLLLTLLIRFQNILITFECVKI